MNIPQAMNNLIQVIKNEKKNVEKKLSTFFLAAAGFEPMAYKMLPRDRQEPQLPRPCHHVVKEAILLDVIQKLKLKMVVARNGKHLEGLLGL